VEFAWTASRLVRMVKYTASLNVLDIIVSKLDKLSRMEWAQEPIRHVVPLIRTFGQDFLHH